MNTYRLRSIFIVLATLGCFTLPLTRTGTPAVRPSAAASAPPNIVLIIIDSLRPDHLSAAGYSRNTTPNLDALVANGGVRFTNATSTAPWTFPANAAMLTGRRPSSLGATWTTTTSAYPGAATPLTEHLHDAGYYNAGFVSSGFMTRYHGFSQGFDHYDDTLSTRPLSETLAGPLNTRALNWLQTTWTSTLSGTQPLFLMMYYLDPHSWYKPPPPYDLRYDSTYTGTLTAERFRNGEDVISGQIVPTARDVEHLIALYDGEIAYTDAKIGELLNYLQSLHLLDNTLVIVTADHGEQFGEHGKWNHSNSLYEEVLRIPLLMRYTGVISAGLVLETPAQSMDLMPTILDYADIPIPSGLDGISLRPLVQGSAPAPARDIYSELDGVTDPNHFIYWLAPRVDLRSVRRGNWKQIHQVGDSNADELYMLQPISLYETTNQASANPSLSQELRRSIMQEFSLYRVRLPAISRP